MVMDQSEATGSKIHAHLLIILIFPIIRDIFREFILYGKDNFKS